LFCQVAALQRSVVISERTMLTWLTFRRVRVLFFVLAAASYTLVLGLRVGAHAGGADSSGYLNQARLLRAGKIHTETRALPELPAPKLSAYAYIPIGFSPANPGDPTKMVANYPIGFPLLIAAISYLFGWAAAPDITMLAHALGGIALMMAWARTLRLNKTFSVIAAAILALSPLYLFTALQALSDLPAMVWVSAAVWCAWRSWEHLGWAAAAGGAFGIAVLIRPTNALAFLPIAVALGGDWRRWGAWAVSGFPALVAFLGFNELAYGHPLRTGYGQIWDAFGAGYIPVTLWHYVRWLPIVLTPFVVFAGALPWATTLVPRARLMLASWITPFFGFYLFYECTHDDWWWLRFVLPAFPAVIVAMLAVAETWMRRRESTTRFPAFWRAVAVGAVLVWLLPWNRGLHAWNVGRRELGYVHACEWARAHLPANAIVVAMQTSGAVYHYTEFPIVHWTFVKTDDLATIERAAQASGRPIYAMLFPYEERPLLHEVFPGNWLEAGAVPPVRFWRRAN
jgi:hypothetical protein